MRLRGQVALVTAAGGPMDHVIAKRLVREGALVAITDVLGARLNAAAVSIELQLIGDEFCRSDCLPDRHCPRCGNPEAPFVIRAAFRIRAR